MFLSIDLAAAAGEPIAGKFGGRPDENHDLVRPNATRRPDSQDKGLRSAPRLSTELAAQKLKIAFAFQKRPRGLCWLCT